MARLIKALIGLALLPLVGAAVYQTFIFLQTNTADLSVLSWFLLGFGLYVLLYVLIFRIRLGFVETFEHEMEHIIAGKLTLRNMDSLKVTYQEGGETKFRSAGLGCNLFVALAPYFMFTVTLGLLALQLLVGQLLPGLQPILNFLIGFTLAYHYMRVWADRPWKQKDLKDSGCLFSLSIIVGLNAILLAFVIAVVTGNLPALGDYFTAILDTAAQAYLAVLNAVGNLLSRI